MLSLKNLVKTYKAKGGVEVRALDGVTVDFPEKGMVFLLGRSGSGKSTLLNVAGGLDTPTSGEIIVKGKSSKDFSAADFDSYRNTYVGFIFQEYNLLNELTVSQNVSVAMQLQNRASDKNAVDKLIESVDLNGVGKRKPNTLSGGQRQRVAIARALIKEPEIIMADEPTGALDYNTGRQILSTLKKLSANRLVIVVSHDRAFAEEFADRIIELSDGKVVSDVVRKVSETSNENNVNFLTEDTVTVKDWSKISQSDIEKIISVMSKNGGETVITSNKKELPRVKSTLNIEDGNKNEKFTKTFSVDKKDYDESSAKFIKSKLPMRYAFKMSGAGLKVKPLRLIFTILLSIIAFTFFGVTSTLMMYKPSYSIATAMKNSDYQSVALEKRYDALHQSIRIRTDGSKEVTRQTKTKLLGGYSEKDLRKLNDNSLGLEFAGVMDLGKFEYTGLSNGDYLKENLRLKYVNVKPEYSWYYSLNEISGFTDCGAAFMARQGFTPLTEDSRYPENYNEVAISEYLFNRYKNSVKLQGYGGNYETPEDLIGETIHIGDLSLKVVGIYNVGLIPEKYAELTNENSQLGYYDRVDLAEEFEDFIEFSFHNICYVSADFYDNYGFKNVKLGKDNLVGAQIYRTPITWQVERENSADVFTERSTALYRNVMKFYDTSGENIEFSISANQIYLSIIDIINKYGDNLYSKIYADQTLKEKFADYIQCYERYSSDRESAADRATIYKTIASEYKNLMGAYYENWSIATSYYVKGAKDKSQTGQELKVIGVYDIVEGSTYFSDEVFISDEIYNKYNLPLPTDLSDSTINTELSAYVSEHSPNGQTDRYSMVITLTDNHIEQSYFMLKNQPQGVSNAMKNSVYDASFNMADSFSKLNIAFLIGGGIFGLFAALMLFNFISVTIESKRSEIGILRAIGARGFDVFKIFITEALIITGVCFLLSSVASAILCSVINDLAARTVISISFLNFRFVNVLIIFAISIIIAFAATILPVGRAAKKSPVDSIRTL